MLPLIKSANRGSTVIMSQATFTTSDTASDTRVATAPTWSPTPPPLSQEWCDLQNSQVRTPRRRNFRRSCVHPNLSPARLTQNKICSWLWLAISGRQTGLFRRSLRSRGYEWGFYKGVAPLSTVRASAWGLLSIRLKADKQLVDSLKQLEPCRSSDRSITGRNTYSRFDNPIWGGENKAVLTTRTKGWSRRFDKILLRYERCIQKIFQAWRCQRLYKGFTPGLFGVVIGSVQFMAYEELRRSTSVQEATVRRQT